MPRRRTRPVSLAQQATGWGILTVLGLIVVWLLFQQARLNPAVMALQAPQAGGRSDRTLAAGPGETGRLPQVPGFTPTGPAQSFGPETLSDKINGKAELYLAAGFRSLAVQSFTLADPPGAYLEVFLYDMGQPENAYAVFSSQRRPGAAVLTFRPHAYATANAVFFTAGQFYVEMILDRALPDPVASLQPFTGALLAGLPQDTGGEAAPPAFPPQGLVADSVRLIAADAFGLAGFQAVYTADYTLPQGQATAFAAQRPDAAQAAADARRFREFLQANGLQVVTDPAIPADITVFSQEGFYEVVMVVDRTVAGVHEATSLAAALELAKNLRQTLTAGP